MRQSSSAPTENLVPEPVPMVPDNPQECFEAAEARVERDTEKAREFYELGLKLYCALPSSQRDIDLGAVLVLALVDCALKDISAGQAIQMHKAAAFLLMFPEVEPDNLLKLELSNYPRYAALRTKLLHDENFIQACVNFQLFEAIRGKDIELARTLLSRGASLDAVDYIVFERKEGVTARQMAKELEIFDQLITQDNELYDAAPAVFRP